MTSPYIIYGEWKWRGGYTCPVCSYYPMADPPRDWNICPCCGTEFGNDDYDRTHAELRAAWEAKGRPWFSRARGGSDTHTAAWPALTLCLIYGPALALGAWMAWRVIKRIKQ